MTAEKWRPMVQGTRSMPLAPYILVHSVEDFAVQVDQLGYEWGNERLEYLNGIPIYEVPEVVKVGEFRFIPALRGMSNAGA